MLLGLRYLRDGNGWEAKISFSEMAPASKYFGVFFKWHPFLDFEDLCCRILSEVLLCSGWHEPTPRKQAVSCRNSG